jgi:hypothetical protein
MRFVAMRVIDRGRGVWLTALVAVVVTLVVPPELATSRAEDAVTKTDDAPPAEDPAEVQRRQQIKQQATHWEQQLTKLLYGDLELIRSVTGDIPRDARKAIARDGEKAVKQGALRLAELQFGGGKRAKEKASDDPTELVSAALVKSLAEHVGSPQATAFTRQIAERSERRQAAAVHAIVAVLDGELFLTAAQREQIERSLLREWSDAMTGALEGMHFVDGRRVFPGLPADCISPHLTDSQRKLFTVQENGAGNGAAQRQTWMRMNALNSAQSAARDPWWFQ